MASIQRQTGMTRLLPMLLLLAAAVGTSACVYRPNIQQGNLLEVEEIDQVTAGMTRSQVRYVLGTPMISDPFTPDRWDYVYRLTRGRSSKAETAHFVVHFVDDKVSRVDKLDLPDPAPVDRKKDKKKKKKKAEAEVEREPPTAPSIKQPQPAEPRPDVRRPGGT